MGKYETMMDSQCPKAISPTPHKSFKNRQKRPGINRVTPGNDRAITYSLKY